MMWNKIVNPETGRKVYINGNIGKRILRKYIVQLGGTNTLLADKKTEDHDLWKILKNSFTSKEKIITVKNICPKGHLSGKTYMKELPDGRFIKYNIPKGISEGDEFEILVSPEDGILPQPILIILRGMSGMGKSSVSKKIIEKIGGVICSNDDYCEIPGGERTPEYHDTDDCYSKYYNDSLNKAFFPNRNEFFKQKKAGVKYGKDCLYLMMRARSEIPGEKVIIYDNWNLNYYSTNPGHFFDPIEKKSGIDKVIELAHNNNYKVLSIIISSSDSKKVMEAINRQKKLNYFDKRGHPCDDDKFDYLKASWEQNCVNRGKHALKMLLNNLEPIPKNKLNVNLYEKTYEGPIKDNTTLNKILNDITLARISGLKIIDKKHQKKLKYRIRQEISSKKKELQKTWKKNWKKNQENDSVTRYFKRH